MLRSALQAGTAERHSVFELFGRRLPDGRRYGVVAGVGRALRALRQFRFDDESLTFLTENGVVDDRTADVAGRLRVPRAGLGLPRGRDLLPGLAAARRRGHVRGVLRAGDPAAQHLQPRLRDRLGGVADDAGRRRAALRRDGVAAHPRAGRGGGRAGGVRRRLRRDVQPRGRPPLRGADHRDGRALLHPAAPRRAGGLHRPARRARRGHDPAGRHLRRRERRPDRRRAHRRPARRGPARLRRPVGARGPRPGPARLPRRDEHPHRGDERPRRERDRRAVRAPRSTATASARPWSPAAATRPPASSTSSWPGPTPTTRTHRWSPWPRRARTRCRSAAASGRCAASTRTGSPRPRRSGWASRRSTTATTGPCSCPWSCDGEIVGEEPLAAARARHAAARAELPIEARKLSKGEAVIPTRCSGTAAPVANPYAPEGDRA